MDEERLRELVIKCIQAENIQNNVISKKKLYVIFTEDWNGQYWSFFEKLDKQNEYEVYAVISNNINNTLHLNNLKKFQICKGIINEDDVTFDLLEDYTTVFPIIPRNLVVKTALCINDTFESNWIFKAMQKGQRIILLKSGLQKFSGKEPLSYKNKILDYYKMLLEFDIEICDWINEKENLDLQESSKSNLSKNYIANNMSFNKNESKSTKKIITEKEIESYVKDNKIILNAGDIITDMAFDKAKSLNISIIKK